LLSTKPNVSTPLEYRMDSAVKSEVKLKTKTKISLQNPVSFLNA
jgi:hypothetical protein